MRITRIIMGDSSQPKAMMLTNIQKADRSILKHRKILDFITQKKQKFQKQTLGKFDQLMNLRNQMMRREDMCFHPGFRFPLEEEEAKEAEV
jgi:hypothetical protein